jgi:hypothetical protein
MKNKKKMENNYKRSFCKLFLVFTFMLISFLLITFYFFSQVTKNDNFGVDFHALSCCPIAENIKNYTKTILSFGTRVPDTAGSMKTIEFIKNELTKFNFNVELRKFTQNTVIGEVSFTNIIAKHKNSLTPFPKSKVLITAHFDSKLFQGVEFLGV